MNHPGDLIRDVFRQAPHNAGRLALIVALSSFAFLALRGAGFSETSGLGMAIVLAVLNAALLPIRPGTFLLKWPVSLAVTAVLTIIVSVIMAFISTQSHEALRPVERPAIQPLLGYQAFPALGTGINVGTQGNCNNPELSNRLSAIKTIQVLLPPGRSFPPTGAYEPIMLDILTCAPVGSRVQILPLGSYQLVWPPRISPWIKVPDTDLDARLKLLSEAFEKAQRIKMLEQDVTSGKEIIESLSAASSFLTRARERPDSAALVLITKGLDLSHWMASVNPSSLPPARLAELLAQQANTGPHQLSGAKVWMVGAEGDQEAEKAFWTSIINMTGAQLAWFDRELPGKGL